MDSLELHGVPGCIRKRFQSAASVSLLRSRAGQKILLANGFLPGIHWGTLEAVMIKDINKN